MSSDMQTLVGIIIAVVITAGGWILIHKAHHNHHTETHRVSTNNTRD